MINTVIVYDKDDYELGDFFSLCRSHVISATQQYQPQIKELHSDDIDIYTFGDHLSEINQSNFLFFGFVHGSPNAMTMNGSEHFLSTSTNYYTLTNAFVYAFSCYNGRDLADILLDNQVHTYWGYWDKAWVCYNFQEDFKECALSGFDSFVLGNTIKDAENMMIDKLNNKIDEIYKVNMVVASVLMQNRDAMVVKGNKDMTIDQFLKY